MKRILAAVLLFLGSAAEASNPTWTGVPIADFPKMGLRSPSYVIGADAWQAPVIAGGYVRFTWYLEEDAAKKGFAFQSASETTVTLPPIQVAGTDEAVGDAGFVIARSRNVVVIVRSTSSEANTVLTQVLTHLTTEPATPGLVQGRDGMGRRSGSAQPVFYFE